MYYTTFPSQNEAEAVIDFLLREKLIACANIMPSVVSHFRIKDSIKRASETVVILKSTREHFDEIKEVFDSMHSFDTPCLIALTIADGAPEFLNWIKEQV